MRDYILPAVAPTSPLPPNPVALGNLQTLIKQLADPVQPVPLLPETARRISGQTYVMEDNMFGWKTLTLTFAEGNPEARALVEINNGTSVITQTALIGMDHRYRLEQSPDGSFVARRGT